MADSQELSSGLLGRTFIHSGKRETPASEEALFAEANYSTKKKAVTWRGSRAVAAATDVPKPDLCRSRVSLIGMLLLSVTASGIGCSLSKFADATKLSSWNVRVLLDSPAIARPRQSLACFLPAEERAGSAAGLCLPMACPSCAGTSGLPALHSPGRRGFQQMGRGVWSCQPVPTGHATRKAVSFQGRGHSVF